MNTIKILASLSLVLLSINSPAQKTALAKKYISNTILFNCSYGVGTFAAGENVGGSFFLGGSLSADWIPNKNNGLSYGLESGMLIGETKDRHIYGIPAIFRLAWYPGFIKIDNIDFFVLVKTGWAFGIWNSNIDMDTSPNGIIGGFNFGWRYTLTPLVDFYSEIGYTYYGLARSSNHPEYPLGYGSGKLYSSLGLSLKLGKP